RRQLHGDDDGVLQLPQARDERAHRARTDEPLRRSEEAAPRWARTCSIVSSAPVVVVAMIAVVAPVAFAIASIAIAIPAVVVTDLAAARRRPIPVEVPAALPVRSHP